MEDAFPQMAKWLQADSTWQKNGAEAAKMVAMLMEWIAPKYARADSAAEAAAHAAGDQGKPKPVTVEGILEAFRSMPAPRAPATPELPSTETRIEPVGPAIPDPELRKLEHQGIPLREGARHAFLPRPPAVPEPVEAPVPRPVIEVEPEPDRHTWPFGKPAGLTSLADFDG